MTRNPAKDETSARDESQQNVKEVVADKAAEDRGWNGDEEPKIQSRATTIFISCKKGRKKGKNIPSKLPVENVQMGSEKRNARPSILKER